VSRLGVSEFESEDVPISNALWPPYEEQHCLEETRLLSKACLDVWRQLMLHFIEKCNVVLHRDGCTLSR
jgi:hypothetical protein